MALIEHSSQVRVHVSKMYSLNSHHNDGKLWVILVSYLIVVTIKTVACILIYRLRWENLYERTLLDYLPPLILNAIQRKERPVTPQANRKRITESAKPENTSGEAVKLCGVHKHEALTGVSMSIMYNQVTVLYSASEFKAMTVLRKLCAGFATPDSGEVHLFGPRSHHTDPVVVSYIHSVIFWNLLLYKTYCFCIAELFSLQRTERG